MGAKIPISQLRRGSQRRAAADAVFGGIAAGRTYDQLCMDIPEAIVRAGGHRNHRGPYWYKWLYENVCRDDGADLCPPPPHYYKASIAPTAAPTAATPIAKAPSRKVFISYRRDDTLHAAGRLCDRLSADLGHGVVFFDVDAIPPGANFVKVIQEAVSGCAVLLAVIGRNWITAADGQGTRRLDNPRDFVRLEILEALKLRIHVIPILFHDATMPSPDELPDEIGEFSLLQACAISGTTFHADVDRLVKAIRAELGRMG